MIGQPPLTSVTVMTEKSTFKNRTERTETNTESLPSARRPGKVVLGRTQAIQPPQTDREAESPSVSPVVRRNKTANLARRTDDLCFVKQKEIWMKHKVSDKSQPLGHYVLEFPVVLNNTVARDTFKASRQSKSRESHQRPSLFQRSNRISNLIKMTAQMRSEKPFIERLYDSRNPGESQISQHGHGLKLSMADNNQRNAHFDLRQF